MDTQNQVSPAGQSGSSLSKIGSVRVIDFVRKYKTLVLGGSILFLIFAGVGGYVLNTVFQKNNTKLAALPTLAPAANQPTRIPTKPLSLQSALASPSPTILPTPTPITYNWNTFFSTYKYLIQYPPDWTLILIKNTDPKIIEFATLNPTASGSAQNNYSITISYSLRTYSEQLTIEPSGLAASVSGILGIKTQVKNSDGGISVHYVIPVSTAASSSSTLIFVAKSQYESTLNQILPTFKLTN